jgi:hypothetical protein
MIFRRRRIRVEVEHSTLHMETMTESIGSAPTPSPQIPAEALSPKTVEMPTALQTTSGLPRKQETL